MYHPVPSNHHTRYDCTAPGELSEAIASVPSRASGSEQPRVFGGIGQERDVTSSLDRSSQHPLMPGTRAGPPARHDASPLVDALTQQRDILVVDGLNLIDTEATHLASPTPVSPWTDRPVAAA